MNIKQYESESQLLALNENSSAQDYAAQALALYRIGEGPNIVKAKMLWEYAKEYMLLTTRV